MKSLKLSFLAGGSGYDVVVPSSSFLARQIEAGVFQKLDKSKLSNIGNMWSDIEEQVAQFGPLNDYSVNYMWGTTGIGYNEGLISERMEMRLQLLWRWFLIQMLFLNLLTVAFILLNAPTEIIPAALHILVKIQEVLMRM